VTLEDSIGDILRKARNSTQTSPEAAAKAAGLSPAAYGAGGIRHGPGGHELRGARPVADPRRRSPQRQAKGWKPVAVDLAQWCELRVITHAAGMTVNAYLVWDSVAREAALFDTASMPRPCSRSSRKTSSR
jgi:hypothetical protein